MSSFEHFRPVLFRHFIMHWTGHVETYTRQVFGFEMPESRLVWLLGGKQPVTAKQLCEAAMMQKSQVSRSLARLRRLGYVQKQPNPNDGRSELLHLTKEGRACFERILDVSLRWSEWVESGLTSTQLKQLDHYLAILKTRAQQMGPLIEVELSTESTKRLLRKSKDNQKPIQRSRRLQSEVQPTRSRRMR